VEEGFKDRFLGNWQLTKARFSDHRYSLDIWHGCLSMSRQDLRGWHANNTKETNKRKKELIGTLEELNMINERNEVLKEHWEERYYIEAQLEQIYQKEELHWQQRGTDKWILMGDANTAYFHTCANGRSWKTRICSLETEDGIIIEQGQIAKHIVEFYKKLFVSSSNRGVSLNPGFWSREGQCGAVEKIKLGEPFTEKDVEKAVEGMKIEFAPRPNGFTVSFFKLWGVIRIEVMKMVHDYNNNALDLRRLNYGVITLVPKVKEANTIKQYRPISLLNVDFKIFTKLLTDRITPMADSLISESQTTFIEGRNILEGVVILHEVIHQLKRTGRKGVIFKIDFEKAYDKVRCDFVQEVVVRKGFPPHWIKQTMSTIQGGRVCINVNCERSPYFATYQGLRQGDPLYPMMFNLVAETLATLMRRAVRQGKIKGALTHLIAEGITHIQYANDTILMVEGDDDSIENMKFILYCFEWMSGLKINYHKSETYILGVDNEERQNSKHAKLSEGGFTY
jgi:hypothetical protein